MNLFSNALLYLKTTDMINLGNWMNGILVGWGLNKQIANTFDEIIIAAELIAIAIGLDFLCQTVFVGGIRGIIKRTHYDWDSLLIKYKIIHHLAHTIPGILVYLLLPIAFMRGKDMLNISQKVCAIYIVISFLQAINGILLMALALFNRHEKMKDRPLKGFVQVLQVLLFFIGGIIIIAILINKSPATLFAGLGASAAILILIFKDTILGFVSGIQLSANNMLRPGDWITVPSANANGIVQEISLNTVKVQNFDNTISTIPPYNLVNGSFQNWRSMSESEGRRVVKSIFLDINSIHFCSSETLLQIQREIPLMKDYQPEKGVIPTNSQLFRVYAERYLCSLPVVNQNLDLIISQRQSTEYGVPIQIYFFSRNKIWKEYERIQSDIFDHFFAIIPQFELKVYQYSE